MIGTHIAEMLEMALALVQGPFRGTLHSKEQYIAMSILNLERGRTLLVTFFKLLKDFVKMVKMF